jgi:hypothetical protein
MQGLLEKLKNVKIGKFYDKKSSRRILHESFKHLKNQSLYPSIQHSESGKYMKSNFE